MGLGSAYVSLMSNSRLTGLSLVGKVASQSDINS